MRAKTISIDELGNVHVARSRRSYIALTTSRFSADITPEYPAEHRRYRRGRAGWTMTAALGSVGVARNSRRTSLPGVATT
jgi:hypothetical protein